MDKFLDRYKVPIGITLVIIILVGGIIILLAKNNLTKLKTPEPTSNEELTNKINELESKIKALEENLKEININYLKKFPEFIEFIKIKKGDLTANIHKEDLTDLTPVENLEKSFQAINKFGRNFTIILIEL